MSRFRATCGAPAAHLVTIVFALAVWALLSPAAIAAVPEPESTAPGAAESWSRYPQPPSYGSYDITDYVTDDPAAGGGFIRID